MTNRKPEGFLDNDCERNIDENMCRLQEQIGEGGESSGGASLPAGGSKGQVLVKKSNTDGDADWSVINTVPTGGVAGQVLTRSQYGTGFTWKDPSASTVFTDHFPYEDWSTKYNGYLYPVNGDFPIENIQYNDKQYPAIIEIGAFQRGGLIKCVDVYLQNSRDEDDEDGNITIKVKSLNRAVYKTDSEISDVNNIALAPAEILHVRAVVNDTTDVILEISKFKLL